VGRGVLHVDVKLLLTSAVTVTGALGQLFPKNGSFSGTFYQCVSSGYQAKPPLKGSVRVGFTIRTNGTVGAVHVTFRKRPHPATGACLTKEVKRWKSPKNPAEPTVVGFSVGR
jgi:hypothetical protein